MKTQASTNQINITLVGNPNVGKSVFFHYLSSVYVDVSNYPGTTVEITSAPIGKDILILAVWFLVILALTISVFKLTEN